MQNLIINLPTNTDSTALVNAVDCRNVITPVGKGRADKQLSVLDSGVTGNTLAYAASKAGKVGKLAREGNAQIRIERAAVAAAKGNWTLAYELIVLESAKTVQPIRNTADFERARGFIAGLRDNLKNGGYSASGKLTSEARELDAAALVFDACDLAIAAQKKADAERRAAQQPKDEQQIAA